MAAGNFMEHLKSLYSKKLMWSIQLSRDKETRVVNRVKKPHKMISGIRRYHDEKYRMVGEEEEGENMASKKVVHNLEHLKTLYSKKKAWIAELSRSKEIREDNRIKEPHKNSYGIRRHRHEKYRVVDEEKKNVASKNKKRKEIQRPREIPEILDPNYEDEVYVKEEIKRPQKKKKITIKEKKPRALEENLPRLSPKSLPEEIKRKIRELDGTDINFVYGKSLYASDISKEHNRFSIPKNQIDISFLTEDEKEIMDKKEDNKIVGMKVGLVGPDGKELRTSFKLWEMRKGEAGRVTYVYNFVENWYKGVVVKYNLKVKDLVQVWSFRVAKNLWFALVKVSD